METSHIILDPNQLTWYFIYFSIVYFSLYIDISIFYEITISKS